MIKENLDPKVYELSKVLAKWLSFHTKSRYEIKSQKLLWSAFYVNYLHDNWEELKICYPKRIKLTPQYWIYSDLMQKLRSSKSISMVIPYPESKFLEIPSKLRRILHSIYTTLSAIKIFTNGMTFNKVSTSERISKKFNIPFIYTYHDLLLFNFLITYRKKNDRQILKQFLKNNISGFNVEILSLVIPSYFVELLPIYKKLSSNLKINELHSWAMNIHENPLILINCLFDNKIKVIGYQHGGGYGCNYTEYNEAELAFYNQFKYWGFGRDNIPPFRYEIENFNKKYSYNSSLKKENTLTFFMEAIYAASFTTSFEDIFMMSNKLRKLGTRLNIVAHPCDFIYVRTKLKFKNKNTTLFNGEKDINFNREDIYCVSINSSLFWKIIEMKLSFICYELKGQKYFNKYNKKLSQCLYSNNLLFTYRELIDLLSKSFLNKVKKNNAEFYQQLPNL